MCYTAQKFNEIFIGSADYYRQKVASYSLPSTTFQFYDKNLKYNFGKRLFFQSPDFTVFTIT